MAKFELISGFLNVNKPAGITSHDVVARLRKWTKVKRIGHTGTLDPQATGVLPIAIGNACRLISYLPQGEKIYLAEILLGVKTSTDDISGLILEKNNLDSSIDRLKIKTVLREFTGFIEQSPPLYSAVKYKGQRLYQLARAKDQAVSSSNNTSVSVLNNRLTSFLSQMKQRKVDIQSIDLIDEQLPLLTLRIICSAGTYIRSLARDIGDALGCGACLKSLCREKSNSFSIERSLSLDTLQDKIEKKRLADLLITPEEALNIKRIELDREGAILISQGRFVSADNLLKKQKDIFVSNEMIFVIYKRTIGQQEHLIPIALAKINEKGLIKPEIVLGHADEFNL